MMCKIIEFQEHIKCLFSVTFTFILAVQFKCSNILNITSITVSLGILKLSGYIHGSISESINITMTSWSSSKSEYKGFWVLICPNITYNINNLTHNNVFIKWWWQNLLFIKYRQHVLKANKTYDGAYCFKEIDHAK